VLGCLMRLEMTFDGASSRGRRRPMQEREFGSRPLRINADQRIESK
jgi:hypothetical protein